MIRNFKNSYADNLAWRATACEVTIIRQKREYIDEEMRAFFELYPDTRYDLTYEPSPGTKDLILRYWFDDHRVAMEFKLRFG
jgi:hypothetical protein